MVDRSRPGRLALSDGEELGRAAAGAREAFPWEGMARATGARGIPGNRVSIQFEGPATFDQWLEAIAGAEQFVHFENYILRDDVVGRTFRDALVAKAREGVPVRVLFDWVGCWATPRRYWRPFREAGVEVRAFNRPRLRDPWGILQRDHRKLVCVDGHTAFVGGFCIGVEWAGEGNRPPWRDTGMEIRGPAAEAAAQAFERIWDAVDEPVHEDHRVRPGSTPVMGDTPAWIIQGEPGRSRVYRSLQLMAAHAVSRLWITDPYFVAPRPVSEALAAAAREGVDVRVLVPAHNNWPWVGSLSRAGYRFLLESGVRLFEWQGPMIHAKTSVVDGLWCRVGSSNINSASLLGNWEIDVGVVDEGVAGQVEGLFLADLASSVEIVLPGTRPLPRVRGEVETRVAPLDPEGTLPERLSRELRSWEPGAGGTRLRISDVVRAGSIFGDALAGLRPLGREDRTVLGTVAVAVLPLAVISAIFPQVAGWTLAVLLAWFGGTAAVRAGLEARRARKALPPDGAGAGPRAGTSTSGDPATRDDEAAGG